MFRSRMTLGCLLLVLGSGFHASREAAGQMHGVPGAPQARMGGMGAAGARPPAAGSSVPMMGRQVGRSGQAAPVGSTNRFSGRFSAGNYKTQSTGAGRAGAMGVGNAESFKAQFKNVQPNVMGF